LISSAALTSQLTLLHENKSKNDKDIGKFSFVNRTITEWNQLPEVAIGTFPVKTHTLTKRVRKVKIREVK
jgi:hypothetical protein